MNLKVESLKTENNFNNCLGFMVNDFILWILEQGAHKLIYDNTRWCKSANWLMTRHYSFVGHLTITGLKKYNAQALIFVLCNYIIVTSASTLKIANAK